MGIEVEISPPHPGQKKMMEAILYIIHARRDADEVMIRYLLYQMDMTHYEQHYEPLFGHIRWVKSEQGPLMLEVNRPVGSISIDGDLFDIWPDASCQWRATATSGAF